MRKIRQIETYARETAGPDGQRRDLELARERGQAADGRSARRWEEPVGDAAGRGEAREGQEVGESEDNGRGNHFCNVPLSAARIYVWIDVRNWLRGNDDELGEVEEIWAKRPREYW